MGKWMLYGANGYTGRLIAAEAVRQGLEPVLAGRSPNVVALAQDLGLESAVFDLGNAAAHLAGIESVVHCAGPFSATSRPMVDACLAAGANYLDITGEIDVFEAVLSRDADARAAGVALCPGVGFDVIPTDCVAARLKEAVPDATHLSLGFDSRSRMSPGTAKTSVEGLASGGRARRDGKIVTVPLAAKTRQIDFGAGAKHAMTIPWGDVSTAWHTTGIPNIEVFVPASPRTALRARRLNMIRPLLGLGPVQNWLKGRAGRARGPSEEQRERAITYVWGEARNDAGGGATARMVTANGYDVTVHGALAVLGHLESHPSPGAWTPARLMGPQLAESLPGSSPITLSSVEAAN